MTTFTLVEKWRATAFLIAGVVFVADAALLAANVAAGTELFMGLGQALVGAGWTAAFIGLLGSYPSLVDRSRRLVRTGAVFAVIGAITMAAMAAASLGYFTGILSGELSESTMYFLPGVFVGIVLGFVPFGVASLRTKIYSRRVGLLYLLLPATFLFNLGTGITGVSSMEIILGVVCTLALAMLTIGYLHRTGSALAGRDEVETSSEPTTG